MGYINFTTIVLVVFSAYVLHSVSVIYTLFKPSQCVGTAENCLQPHYDFEKPLALQQKFTVSIFTSTTKTTSARNLRKMLIWKKEDFNVMKTTSILVNVTIPRATRQNGTLFVHLSLHPQGTQPFDNDLASYTTAPLTKYVVKQGMSFNLMSANKAETNKSTSTSDAPVTHWRPRLTFYVLTDPVSFDRFAVPSDVYSLLRFSPDGKYNPLLYIDELEMLERNLKPIDPNTTEMSLEVEYSPIGIGKLRVWRNVQESMVAMKNLGFSDKDLDEVKGIFTDTNLYLVGLTFTISVIHLMFDFLAIKNDIMYWRKRSTTVGLSIRAVCWRCISTAIIFLYLLNEKTSLLVLIPTGIGVLIEAWKVRKALKITITWSVRRLPSLQFGQKSNEEKETEEFDSQAMKYLSYPLCPLLILGAIYSLVYQPHKSWYSWTIKSAVNGVYVFGFLFMLPQLFVNYKLKSVAHLPWRSLMYKAFNTFIDDLFAFIITMPTAHRLACFRDDVVFVIYIYQRWLYPVDVTRVNEYGVSYEEDTKEHKD